MHLSDRSGPVRPNGGLGALQAVWTDGFDEMRPLLRTIRDRDAQRRIEILVLRYLGGRAELFDRFADGWAGPPSLAHHDAALRLHRLARDELRRTARSGVLSSEFRDLQARCCRHLELGRVRSVLIGGAPSERSSRIADALGNRHGAVVLRHGDEGPDEAGHRHLLQRAERLLHLGEHVVLDAPWANDPVREAARDSALRSSSDVVELWCHPPVPDGDPHSYDPWPEATVLAPDLGLDHSVDVASAACGWPTP
ncbi:MAG TPA: hypothetical protein PKY13_04680 [Microthrixaceae bacterium]|jgi:hypothetical protein|nr:hypothetical protein [Microthrixaceae bacterium]HQF93102.1 hypothetical protein [Microthrixaceae bacterium]